MHVKSGRRHHRDPLLLLALAWAAGASMVSLLILNLGPAALFLVGVAAIPFAASHRNAITFRVIAALALGAVVPYLGPQGLLLAAPPALALLGSAVVRSRRRARRRHGW